MKQNKRTTILKLALLAVCIAVLAASLVACGGNNQHEINNQNIDSEELVNQDEIISYLAYYLTYGRRESTFMLNYSLQNAGLNCMALEISLEGSSNIFTAYIFNDAASAAAEYESLKNENRLGNIENVVTYGCGSELIGNKIIVDYPQGHYKNVVMKSEIPSDITKPCVDFMCDVVKKIFEKTSKNTYSVMIDQYTDPTGYRFQAVFVDVNYNVSENYIMTNDPTVVNEYREDYPSLYDNYTDDSYIDFNREKGYVFAKLIEKSDAK